MLWSNKTNLEKAYADTSRLTVEVSVQHAGSIAECPGHHTIYKYTSADANVPCSNECSALMCTMYTVLEPYAYQNTALPVFGT